MLFCYKNPGEENLTPEIKYASRNKKLLMFDPKTKKFYKDIGCKIPAKIEGEKVTIRVNRTIDADKLADAVLRNGGIVESHDRLHNSNILHWPRFGITNKRMMTMMIGEEILNYPEKSLLQLVDRVSGRSDKIFIKTKSGDFSTLVSKSEITRKDSPLRKMIEKYPNEEYIISEPIEIERDNLGEKQYRSVVINHSSGQPMIQSISRPTIDVYHSIEEEIAIETEKIVQNISSKLKLPEGYIYIVDTVEFRNKQTGKVEVDILEVKPIATSTLFLYNSINDIDEHEGKNKKNIEELTHSGEKIYDISSERKQDFIESGDIPLTEPTKQVIPLEIPKKSKFEKGYKLLKQIEREKGKTRKKESLYFSQAKSKKDKQSGKDFDLNGSNSVSKSLDDVSSV